MEAMEVDTKETARAVVSRFQVKQGKHAGPCPRLC